MSSQCCQVCKKTKSKAAFSRNQLTKPKRQRKCKKCIKNAQKKKIQNKIDNKQITQITQKPNKHQELQQFKNDLLAKANQEMNEPGKQTLLQKLHKHCIGRSVFTEIHLGIKINKSSKQMAYAAQKGLENMFKPYPDTFIYHERVIIASNDPSLQHSIYLSIKQDVPLPIIGIDTRCCFSELLYPNGKISRDGVIFNIEGNTIYNTDISVLLANIAMDIDYIQTGYKNVARLGLNEKEHKIFKKCNSTIKKSSEIENKSKHKMEDIKSNHASNIKNNTNSLYELQQQLKIRKNNLNQMREKLNNNTRKMDVFNVEKVQQKWDDFRDEIISNNNNTFNQNNLEKMVNIIQKLPIISTCNIDKKRGHGSHIILNINTKIITISKDMKNRDFIKHLNEILTHYTKEFENEANDNNNNLDEKVQEMENDENEIIESIKEEQDSLERLIIVYQTNIDKHKICIKKAERAFAECLNKINKLIQDKIIGFQQYIKSIVHEFWNMELAPNKLILDSSLLNEPFFIDHVMEKKEKIIEWMVQNVDKYENIKVYGIDTLYLRFINFIMNSGIIWWIAVLRWLKLPISVTNLNLLMSYSRQSVTSYFSKIPVQKKEIDIIMVVTYFMNMPTMQYQSKPFQFKYTESKNIMLSIEKYNEWENETEIIKFSNHCISFVIKLIENYTKSSSVQILNKHIDIYMHQNGTM